MLFRIGFSFIALCQLCELTHGWRQSTRFILQLHGESASQSVLSIRGGGSELKEHDGNDFGAYFRDAYGVTSLKEDDEDATITIQDGSLNDALVKARTQARLLVTFIPSSKPKNKNSLDQKAIKSILSSEVAQMAEKKSRKKGEGGSFLIWSAKAGSQEAATAMKRLKVKKGAKNTPTLLVCYPTQTLDSSGRPKVSSRILAHHHCNPPPSPNSMAAWLNTLRKRHAKQYAVMQHGARELALLKERTEGYKSSVEDDARRAAQERKEEEERLEKERKQKKREEEMEMRRASLFEDLPEEPESIGEGIITIALRFGDGRTGQRRFTEDTEIESLFNWVDAVYKEQREYITLTTMNGQKSFSFEEQSGETLKDAGFGRMTGLRVLINKIEEDEVENKEDENE